VYQEFYRFPSFVFRLDWSAVGIALLVSVVAAVAAAAGAVRRVVRLPPAAAMQPEPPARFKPGPLERLGLARWLNAPGRIIVRNLERRPLRAALSAIGIAFAAAILVAGRFSWDAMSYMADMQFRQVQRENLTVTFSQPRSAAVGYAVARLPGVLRAETFRAVPVRLRSQHRSRRVALLGLDPGGELRRLVGRDRRSLPLPPDGLVLTAKLAEVLRIAPGDTVSVEVLEGARPVRGVAVAGVVDELFGLNAYMDARAAHRLLREGGTVSGAFLRTDPRATAALYRQLKRMPVVGGVSSRDAALASFESTLARSVGIVTAILVGSAGALAVGMVYNAARIALSERGRELASLRVLGFTRAEVALMLLGEQALLTVLGIGAGLALGYGIAVVVAGLYQWELFRFPIVVTGRTYLFAAGVVLAAAIASALLVRRRINRLDLVAVLKTRE
jgi:putative ABC transport system permease protein